MEDQRPQELPDRWGLLGHLKIAASWAWLRQPPSSSSIPGNCYLFQVQSRGTKSLLLFFLKYHSLCGQHPCRALSKHHENPKCSHPCFLLHRGQHRGQRGPITGRAPGAAQRWVGLDLNPSDLRGALLAKPPPSATLWEAWPRLTKHNKRQTCFQLFRSFITKTCERSTGH